AEVWPACRALGITLVAYSPLGRGFLTGQYTSTAQFSEGDFRLRAPRFVGENFEHNLALVEAVRAQAAARKCTPAQFALAWVLARGTDVVAIPGTRRVTRLEENANALEVKLSAEEAEEIAAALPAVRGDRYPEGSMRSVNR